MMDLPGTGTAKIAEALAAFQADMPPVAKGKRAEVPTKSGGKYSYTYADLADISEAALPVLSRHGLAFSTCPKRSETGGYELLGRLLHASGEHLEGALPIAGNSPQEIGSALTYMRRYLLGCLTGLVTDDDDDGALAQQAAKKQQPRKRAPRETGETISDAQLKMLGALMGEAGIKDRPDRLAYVSAVIGRDIDSSKSLTRAEASRVIDQLQARAAQEADDGGEPEGWR